MIRGYVFLLRLAVVKAELILNCTEKDRDKLEKLCQVYTIMAFFECTVVFCMG